MKERPILFNAQMVRAVQNGTKTQTRRIFKLPKDHEFGSRYDGQIVYQHSIGECSIDELACPYGQPGDRLWVRENCQAWEYESGEDVVRYPADGAVRRINGTKEEVERWIDLSCYAGRKHTIVPSIHMPRWASRIMMEIVSVRVERLNDITEEDALAEGVTFNHPVKPSRVSRMARDAYADLWESINGAGSWEANPWVWVVEFKVVQA